MLAIPVGKGYPFAGQGADRETLPLYTPERAFFPGGGRMSKVEHIVRMALMVGAIVAAWIVDIPKNASVSITIFGVVLLSLMLYGGRPE